MYLNIDKLIIPQIHYRLVNGSSIVYTKKEDLNNFICFASKVLYFLFQQE